jgi:hypothetical protein
MANTIQIRRSTSSNAPTSPGLAAGELAYSGGAGAQNDYGQRLMIGDPATSNTKVIGGEYFTAMMDHVTGTLTASSALLVDSNSKIDKLLSGNIRINNTAGQIDTASGNLIMAPAGDLILTMGGGTLDMSNTNANEIKIADNQATSLILKTADHNYITLNTTNGSEKVLFGRNAEFDGTIQADATVTVGVDDTGHDVKFFGATTGKSWLWDESDNKMIVTGDASISGTTTLSGGMTIPSSQTINMGANRVQGVADPSSAQDAATKAYVDAVKQALDIKDSVRVATTANVTIATGLNVGDAIDGVTLADGDRVLVKNQSTGTENGIYVAGASPARAADANVSAEVTAGMFCFVEEGTTNGDNGYVLTTNGTITLGSTALTFVQFSGAGQIIDGNGLVKSGNTLNLDLATNGGLVFSGAKLKVDLSLGSIDGTLDETGGGTGNSSYATGDLLYANGTNQLTKLTKPANSALGVFLSMTSAGVPTWESIDGGTYS